MVDEELHFKTILRRKNAAKARIYRKSVIDDKKSKRLKIALKENGTFDKRRDNDSTALRIPLSELSPNMLNDGRGIANVEVSRQLHSSLKTKPSTNNNIRSKRISSRNITKLGVNLSKRFDNTFLQQHQTKIQYQNCNSMSFLHLIVETIIWMMNLTVYS